MTLNVSIEILKLAALGQLPRAVDRNSAIDLSAFKELYMAGLVEAKDASADTGDCYLEPAITTAGREYLRIHSEARSPWWSSFDKRVTVVGLVVAVLGLAAALGLFSAT
jgi:hypothetical protein